MRARLPRLAMPASRTQSVLPFYLTLLNYPKNGGKELDFPVTGCKLCFGTGFRSFPSESGFHAHYIGYFSKRKRESAKFQKQLFCSRKRNTPARTIVSSFLAGRFSVVSGAGSWRNLRFRAEIRPAFFVFFPPHSDIFFKNDAEPARHEKKSHPCALL